MSSQDGQSPAPAISPPLIVGIVILSAFVVIIIAASVFRFCRHSNSRTGDNANFDDNLSDVDLFNPNQVRPATQVIRMREVRWINNMYAWERGRQARLEIGELRPTTMIAGNRKGEARNWDEWSVWENRESMANPTGDHSGASYFYNVDDPYAPSSQQRLSQAPSVLLPQPVNVNLNLNQGWRDSRLRHSCPPSSTQNPDLRGKNEEREEEAAAAAATTTAANTDVAVVDDNPSSKPANTTNGNNNMEDLAAGVGVGLGLGPGSGYQAVAQQAIKENGTHQYNHVKNETRNPGRHH